MIKILLVLAQVYCQLNGIPYTCDPNNCKLPNCKCATNDPPVANPPQFIVITFDDAVQESIMPQAKATFENRINPNGCSAKATFFAQALYSDPFLLTKWYSEGNEIADHSFTHTAPFSGTQQEFDAMRNWASSFGGIPKSKIKGVRFPLRSYTVEAIETMARMGFEYDSSLADSLTKPIWPYTLDSGVVTECNGMNSICGKPINAKGFWEIPMYGSQGIGGVHLMDPFNDFSLANPIPPQQVTDDLMNAFNQHYTGNKAPFGVYMHPLWIGPEIPGAVPDGAPKLAAINKFLDQATAKDDVWIVTNYQIIQYMKNPVPYSELGAQDYMQCDMNAPTNICNGLSNVGVETCPGGVLKTCYGCYTVLPSLTNPAPVSASQRCKVPEDTCDTKFWDPIECKCLCKDFPTCSEWKMAEKPAARPAGQGGKPKSSAQRLSLSLISLMGPLFI